MPTYDLFADIINPDRFVESGNVQHGTGSALPLFKRVFIENYESKALAQWWGININRIYIDAEKTQLVPTHMIFRFVIVEVPP